MRVAEIGQQLGELVREVVGRELAAVSLQRDRGRLVAPRRPAEAEVDPPGIEAAQHAERLRDLERAVVRQHDAAAPHAQAGGRGRDRADQHLGARAGQHGCAVVLGDPVAVISELVGPAREIDRVAERVPAGRALRDRRLIQNAQQEPSAGSVLGYWQGRHDPLYLMEPFAQGRIESLPEPWEGFQLTISTRRLLIAPFLLSTLLSTLLIAGCGRSSDSDARRGPGPEGRRLPALHRARTPRRSPATRSPG